MTIRRYKIKDRLEQFQKLIEGSPLSGKAKALIKIGGKATKLPKKIRQGAKESYRRLHQRFKQAP